MQRQQIVTNWKAGEPPRHTYTDLGPGRARPTHPAHTSLSGGGAHLLGTKAPPTIEGQHRGQAS